MGQTGAAAAKSMGKPVKPKPVKPPWYAPLASGVAAGAELGKFIAKKATD